MLQLRYDVQKGLKYVELPTKSTATIKISGPLPELNITVSISTMKLSIPFCTLLFAASTLATVISRDEPVSYNGVKVVRVQVGDTEAQVTKVKKLITSLGLVPWTRGFKIKQQVDVQVESEKFAAFQRGLGEIPYTVMYEDLGASIRNESESVLESFDGDCHVS